MLEFIFNALFALINPISLLALIAVFFAFNIPARFFGLYICSVTAFVAAMSIPYNVPYFSPGRFDFIAHFTIDCSKSILFIGFAIAIVVKIKSKINSFENHRDIGSIGTLTYAAYGCLTAYFYYLFCTDFFEGYQSALEAYIIIVILILLIFILGLYIKVKNIFGNNNILKDIYLFFYSFSFFMMVIMLANAAFAFIAYKQTKKVVAKNDRYCIQTKGRELNSWLELTPLTIWNKPMGRRSTATRHTVLVVKNSRKQAIYHWSYRLRSWQYNAAEFKPKGELVPSSLDCTLEENYLKNLPLLISEIQTLSLESKQFRIPIQYVPRQYKLSVGNKIISFYAILPNFATTIQALYRLLPEGLLPVTRVEITTADTGNIENTWFKPYSKLEITELEDKYGLQQRTIPQIRYKRQRGTFNLTKETQQHVQYYKKEKGIVTTLVFCSPDRISRLNCQHHFIKDNLQYSFRHSDRDLKDWVKLQAALISKIQSWKVKKADL